MEDKQGIYILGIIALVAIVAVLVLVFSSSGTMKAPATQFSTDTTASEADVAGNAYATLMRSSAGMLFSINNPAAMQDSTTISPDGTVISDQLPDCVQGSQSVQAVNGLTVRRGTNNWPTMTWTNPSLSGGLKPYKTYISRYKGTNPQKIDCNTGLCYKYTWQWDSTITVPTADLQTYVDSMANTANAWAYKVYAAYEACSQVNQMVKVDAIVPTYCAPSSTRVCTSFQGYYGSGQAVCKSDGSAWDFSQCVTQHDCDPTQTTYYEPGTNNVLSCQYFWTHPYVRGGQQYHYSGSGLVDCDTNGLYTFRECDGPVIGTWQCAAGQPVINTATGAQKKCDEVWVQSGYGTHYYGSDKYVQCDSSGKYDYSQCNILQGSVDCRPGQTTNCNYFANRLYKGTTYPAVFASNAMVTCQTNGAWNVANVCKPPTYCTPGATKVCSSVPGYFGNGQAVCKSDGSAWDYSQCVTQHDCNPGDNTLYEPGTSTVLTCQYFWAHPYIKGTQQYHYSGSGLVDCDTNGLYIFNECGSPTIATWQCTPGETVYRTGTTPYACDYLWSSTGYGTHYYGSNKYVQCNNNGRYDFSQCNTLTGTVDCRPGQATTCNAFAGKLYKGTTLPTVFASNAVVTCQSDGTWNTLNVCKAPTECTPNQNTGYNCDYFWTYPYKSIYYYSGTQAVTCDSTGRLYFGACSVGPIQSPDCKPTPLEGNEGPTGLTCDHFRSIAYQGSYYTGSGDVWCRMSGKYDFANCLGPYSGPQ